MKAGGSCQTRDAASPVDECKKRAQYPTNWLWNWTGLLRVGDEALRRSV